MFVVTVKSNFTHKNTIESNMTKLEQLYNSIQTLKELGVQLPQGLIEETNRVEEEIIKNDIIPALAETISPIIEQIQREIILVVEYTPNEPLIVKLTRKRSFAIPLEQDINDINIKKSLPFENKKQAIDKEKGYSVAYHSKSKKTVLAITFPNGKMISNQFASQTFCDVIEIIGIEKVRKLDMICCGVRLVDNKRDDFYNQYQVNSNTFIITHSSTREKKRMLDEISDKLGLGLKVEII